MIFNLRAISFQYKIKGQVSISKVAICQKLIEKLIEYSKR